MSTELIEPNRYHGKAFNIPLGIGFALTVVWFLFFVCYISSRLTKIVDLDPNAFGDFLAGFFAPLAFLWLFVATLLQRQELGLQRHELVETREVFRRTVKANADQSLIRQRNEINAAIIRHSMKGPFATILNIPEAELKNFNPKTGVLFFQINLLEDVYQGRDILGDDRVQSYRTWATEILGPWITSDPQLRAVMGLIYDRNDLMDKNFVVWLKQLIPMP